MTDGWVLNPLDIIIIAIIGFGMYRGAMQGIFAKATTAVSIGFSVLLGFRLRYLGEILYRDYLNLQLASEVIAVLSFATVFVIVFILINTGLRYLTQGLSKINMSIDKALGAVAGGTIATLVLSVGFVLLAFINFPSADNAKGSLLYPHVRNFARYSLGLGVGVLREASQQVNSFGISDKPNDQAPPPASQQPSSRPSPIR